MSELPLPEGFERVICGEVVSVPKPLDWILQGSDSFFRIKPPSSLLERDTAIGIVDPAGAFSGAEAVCGRTPLDGRGLRLQILSDVKQVYGRDPNTVADWHFTRDRGLFAPFREVAVTEANGIVSRFGETRRPHLVDELGGGCWPAALCYFVSIAHLVRNQVYLMRFEAYNAAVDPERQIVEQAGKIMILGASVYYPDEER